MRNRCNVGIMAVILFAGFSSCESVFAYGEADGQWFKVRYRTTNARRVDMATGEVNRSSSRGICYIQLTHEPDEGDPIGTPGGYLGIIVCQSSAGEWAQTAETFTLSELPGARHVVGQDGLISLDADDVRMGFTNRRDHFISGFGSHLLRIMTNGNGGFKEGRFHTLAGTLDDATTLDGGETTMIGGYVVRGISISESALPFDPELI